MLGKSPRNLPFDDPWRRILTSESPLREFVLRIEICENVSTLLAKEDSISIAEPNLAYLRRFDRVHIGPVRRALIDDDYFISRRDDPRMFARNRIILQNDLAFRRTAYEQTLFRNFECLA